MDNGASNIKWIVFYPCLGSSEIELIYTNFEFCGGKFLRHSIYILIYNATKFMMTKTISRIIYIF
jgi:hypothetical protein